jgi:hypothetical protein
MRHLLQIAGWQDIWVNGCEVCGHTWISRAEHEAIKCPSRACRTEAWNGKKERKSRQGRKSKLELRGRQYIEDPVLRLILDASQDGRHHLLCSCLLCLRQIKSEQAEREEQLWQMWRDGLHGKIREQERQERPRNGAGMMHGQALGDKRTKRPDTCLAKPALTTWKKWEQTQLQGALLRYQAQENAQRLAPGGRKSPPFAPVCAPPSLCQDEHTLSGQGAPARHGHNFSQIFFTPNFF